MKRTLLIGCSLLMAACSTDEIDKWSTETSLAWFTSIDVTNYTFATESDDVTQAIVEIPITLATPIVDRERRINIEVVRDAANPATTYEIKNPVIVPAGLSAAALRVMVSRTANLATETDTLVFAIIPSEDFQPGLEDYRQNTLVIYDNFLRPSWWDDSNYNTSRAVGACNSLKLAVWWEVFGNFEDPRGGANWWTGNEAVLALFRLDEYSQEHYGKAYIDLESGDQPL